MDMKKEVMICDCCGEIIDETYGPRKIKFKSEKFMPIYQDVVFDEYTYDFCGMCASDFPRMFKEFMEWRKSKKLK